MSTWEGTKVLLQSVCLLTPASQDTVIRIPVVNTVAPLIADRTFETILHTLKQPQEGYAAFSEAKTVGEFYLMHENQGTVTPQYGCLIIVRGTFGTQMKHPKPTAQALPFWTHERLKKIGLARPPALYMEFLIDYVGGTPPTHMVLKPVFLDYQQTAARKTGPSGRKTLLLVFELRTSQPLRVISQRQEQRNTQSGTQGLAEDLPRGDILALFSSVMQDVKIGTRVTREVLSPLSSQIQTLPAAARMVVQDDGSIQTVPLTVPFQVTFMLTETEQQGVFFQQTSEALLDNKTPLRKEETKRPKKGGDSPGKEGKSTQ